MSKKNIVVFLELLIYAIIAIIMSYSLSNKLLGGVLFGVSLIILIFATWYKIRENYGLSANILFPTWLSIFQNIYLGLFSTELGSLEIQILTIINFIYACIIFILLFVMYGKVVTNGEVWKQKIFYLTIILTLYSFMTAFMYRVNLIALFASFRNIISVFLFLLIGILAAGKSNKNYIFNIILILGTIVIIFGFLDIQSKGELWRQLNITELWTKKGITLQPSGLPTNFFSSETINGERIRRMASTFADPVNLGSFLVVIFCIAWIKNKKTILVLTIIAMILTVSKSALLGALVFITVYAYYNFTRIYFCLTALMATLCSLGYLTYAYITSSNSVFLHISGFLAAFKGLTSKPLGSGMGSAGILARQFVQSHNEEITESGIGMIIGQLGIVGLAIYSCIFVILYKRIITIRCKKNKVMVLSLFFSILLNICFNEVALSPNTCAIYFLIIGLYIGEKVEYSL